jgi:hypothetical protein
MTFASRPTGGSLAYGQFGQFISSCQKRMAQPLNVTDLFSICFNVKNGPGKFDQYGPSYKKSRYYRKRASYVSAGNGMGTTFEIALNYKVQRRPSHL